MSKLKEGQPTRMYLELQVAVNRMSRSGEYFDAAQWMLDNARACGDWSPLPAGVTPGPMKACYWNSINLAKRGKDRYVYMEGWATHIIPVQHAWCYDRETGLVVDPTWEDGFDYIGVPCRWQYAKRCLTKGHAAVLNWMERYPIPMGKLPPKVWKVDL